MEILLLQTAMAGTAQGSGWCCRVKKSWGTEGRTDSSQFVDKVFRVLYNCTQGAEKGRLRSGDGREEYLDTGHREGVPRLEAPLSKGLGKTALQVRRPVAHR
jgi:hypothetical protein